MTLGGDLVSAMDLKSLLSNIVCGQNACWSGHKRLSEAPSVPMFGAKRPHGQGGQNDLLLLEWLRQSLVLLA